MFSEEELEIYFLSFVDKQQSPLVLIKKVYAEVVAKKETELLQKQKAQQSKKVLGSLVEQIYEEVVIDGLRQLPYESCKLCTPQAGQKIVAKVDRTGIKIHQVSCPAIKTITFDKFMEAHWRQEDVTMYKVTLTITMPNESSNLISLMSLFKQLDIAIEHMSVDSYESNMFTISIECLQQNPTKISFLLKNLKMQYTYIT